MIDADRDSGDETTRFLGCTLYQPGRGGKPVYVHSKAAVVDDAWLTIGSANLNEHSLFNDTEANVVTDDPDDDWDDDDYGDDDDEDGPDQFVPDADQDW